MTSTDQNPASEGVVARGAVVVRFVIVAGLVADGILMWRWYGVTTYGLDVMLIYLCLGFVLPVLALANLPAFVMVGGRAGLPWGSRRLLLAMAPLVVVVGVGAAILFGDWEKFWLLLLPTLPALAAVVTFARVGGPRDARGPG